MNVAVDLTGFDEWLGGIDFVKAYMNALCKIENYHLFVFVQKKTMVRHAKNFVKFFLGRYDSKMKKPIKEFLEFSESIVGAKNVYYKVNRFEQQLRDNKIDIVFPVLQNLGKDFTIPWLPYLFDFQHKYLPQFFTQQEQESRDKSFEALVTSAKACVVEANDVINDVKKFIPNATAKFFVMPYTAIPEKEWLELDAIDISKYNLPTKYFLISNQFWVHKNHGVAFEALAEVVKTNPDVHIVCTGNTNDYRNPDYFPSLLKKIEELGIKGNVHILGYISKLEQIKIMCNSVGVIQPTLFEGNPGGGIAYNALAMDIPIILSDISVNKELNYEKADFFEAKNAKKLAAKMKLLLGKNNNEVRKSKEELVAAGSARMNKLCESINEAITRTVKLYGTNY